MSAVQPTTEMTTMIETSRMLEANINVMKTHNEMLARPDRTRSQGLIYPLSIYCLQRNERSHEHSSTLHGLHRHELDAGEARRDRQQPGERGDHRLSRPIGPTSRTSSIARRNIPAPRTAAGQYTPTGIAIGTGSRVQSTQSNFTQGSLQQTGNNLDVAIQGQGLLPDQGSVGHHSITRRAGNFSRNANGQIVMGSANIGRLLEPAITIPQRRHEHLHQSRRASFPIKCPQARRCSKRAPSSWPISSTPRAC